MSQPFIGEIRLFGGNFAPQGWMFCEGQLLPISQNDALFALIGTTYGGDGQTTFALPDLRGRLPIHQNSSHVIGETGGVETVTLTANQIPVHAHALQASASSATATTAAGNVLAQTPTYTPYISGVNPDAALSPLSVSPDGGSQSHANVQPYLCVSFIISIFGTFPSQA